jgi:hypothetical protein
MDTLKKCFNWLLRDSDFQRDAYLAKAVDVADLERLIRQWERHAQSRIG